MGTPVADYATSSPTCQMGRPNRLPVVISSSMARGTTQRAMTEPVIATSAARKQSPTVTKETASLMLTMKELVSLADLARLWPQAQRRNPQQ